MTIPKLKMWIKKSNKTLEVAAIDFPEKEAKSYANTIYSFDDIELMQSTGFKDKNGREIFESDIVKVLNSLYTVFYDSEKGSFRLKPHDKRWHTDYMSNFSHGGNFEVIGNMYENPELLEVK